MVRALRQFFLVLFSYVLHFLWLDLLRNLHSFLFEFQKHYPFRQSYMHEHTMRYKEFIGDDMDDMMKCLVMHPNNFVRE
jgi:hypothetical protein